MFLVQVGASALYKRKNIQNKHFIFIASCFYSIRADKVVGGSGGGSSSSGSSIHLYFLSSQDIKILCVLFFKFDCIFIIVCIFVFAVESFQKQMNDRKNGRVEKKRISNIRIILDIVIYGGKYLKIYEFNQKYSK